MSVVNDFLPFCPTDTGTNLLEQSDYAAAANRNIGNQPGVASSQLVNKAIRQPSFVASQLAQFVANVTNTNVNDDANTAKLLAQMTAAFAYLPPVFTTHTSGTGAHNLTYYFGIAVGNATVGATYTNNSQTFTVTKTVSAGTILQATGPGAPTVSGVLTKASGTGDSTLSFYAVRSTLYMKVIAVGGGGGGGSASGTGSDGSDTTFGTSLIVAGGGKGGLNPGNIGGVGGTATLGGLTGVAMQGNYGWSGNNVNLGTTPNAASGPFGGAPLGYTSSTDAASIDSPANSGAGGVAGSSNNGGGPGGGGGAGGYVNALIPSPLSTYNFSIGGGGAGAAGSAYYYTGGAGGSGVIIIEEHYQ